MCACENYLKLVFGELTSWMEEIKGIEAIENFVEFFATGEIDPDTFCS